MSKVPLRVNIDSNDKDKLDQIAKDKDLPIAYLIRRLIRDHLDDLKEKL